MTRFGQSSINKDREKIGGSASPSNLFSKVVPLVYATYGRWLDTVEWKLATVLTITFEARALPKLRLGVDRQKDLRVHVDDGHLLSEGKIVRVEGRTAAAVEVFAAWAWTSLCNLRSGPEGWGAWLRRR